MRAQFRKPPLQSVASVAMLRAYEAGSATKPGETLLTGEPADGLPQQTVSSFETCAQVVVAPEAVNCTPRLVSGTFELIVMTLAELTLPVS
jgi:hypothetical protein